MQKATKEGKHSESQRPRLLGGIASHGQTPNAEQVPVCRQQRALQQAPAIGLRALRTSPPPSPPCCPASRTCLHQQAGTDPCLPSPREGDGETQPRCSQARRAAELARIWARASKPWQGPGLIQPDCIWTELLGMPSVRLQWLEPHQWTPVHLWDYLPIPPLLLERSPAHSAFVCPAKLLIQSRSCCENHPHRSPLGSQGLQTVPEGCWQGAGSEHPTERAQRQAQRSRAPVRGNRGAPTTPACC